MSHLVEQMAYVGATPWHGLGKQLAPHQPLQVWAEQAGLSFSILETPVCYQAQGADPFEAIAEFTGHKVLYRSDTQAPLSVVSDRYKVVQPEQVLEFYRDLTQESGFELETAGVLKGGRKLWALARTGQSAVLKGSDTVNGYVLLATACDGTLATTAQFTSVRVVCNNTLGLALAEGSAAIKVRHNTRFDAQRVKRQLGLWASTWDAFMYRMRTLSERRIQSHEAMNFYLNVFDDPQGAPAMLANARAMKTAQNLYEGHGLGAELSAAKGTAWGLLSSNPGRFNTTYTINTTAMEHLTIWDGGGIDKLDFSTATAPCIVDMRPSTFSSVNLKTPQMLIDEGIALLQAQGKSGAWVDNYVRQVITEPTSGARFYTGKDNVAIVAGTVIEDLLTGSGNDQVRDNFVNNIIFTGAGNDTIFLGAGGFDYVNGGLGTDTAVFTVAQSSVQKEKQVDGSWLVVAATYAAQLVGVERFEFTDGTFFA